ncbi:MAG: hypothetical protein Q9217_005656 [Psora testacea]
MSTMSSKQSSRERFPELYVPVSSHTDPHTRTRSVPMRVLCLGMPRTGTASMRTALKQLGYTDCYHMLNVIENPPDADMWLEAINVKYHGEGKKLEKEDWDKLLGDCQAVCDLPAIAFSEELIKAYPEAKVVLNLRNVDSWYESMIKSIVPLSRSPIMNILEPFDPVLLKRWNPMRRGLWTGFWQNQESEDMRKKVFVEHYDRVRRLVPRERLLEYKVGEGWGKLCEFLEVPVPCYDFPVTNDSSTFEDRINVLVGLAVQRSAKRILPLLGAVIVAGIGIWIYSKRQ